MSISSGDNFYNFSLLLLFTFTLAQQNKFVDICGHINGQRIYLDYGEKGSLEAKFNNNIVEKYYGGRFIHQRHCSIEFLSCPSCIITFQFKFLNLSKCEIDHLWIYEPGYEKLSKEFCGRYVFSNLSLLDYKSKTRKAVIDFLYTQAYDFAFNLTYTSERNRIEFTGFPKYSNLNNISQMLTSPFFPSLYPSDLIMEYKINCITANETCRISLIFTDFLIAPATILDFFDSNSKRIFATTGNIFRPPVIMTSGPSLTIRFYANGAADLGFKVQFSFILGPIPERQIKSDINCGGQVNNLGGGITMMSMIPEGSKSFDCLWLIKPPESYLHKKTHLSVKVVNFSGFAGTAELIIRQGLTSNGPVIESVKFSAAHSSSFKKNENIVPISQGFYVRLRGFFNPESKLTLAYAAFSYKDCLMGSDFVCGNKKCISKLLRCDGFDHCGDESDELACIKEARNSRPHFLFPKEDDLDDLATSTVIFLLCCFGLVGFIFAMVLVLYRVNIKSRHQRHLQTHIETINAILEDGAGVIEEEIIISDDPPDYEAPPDYDVVTKNFKDVRRCCSRCENNIPGTSAVVPDSPPPSYEDLQRNKLDIKSNVYKILEKFHIASTGNYVNERFMMNNDSQLSEFSFDGGDNGVATNLRKSFTTDDVNLFI